ILTCFRQDEGYAPEQSVLDFMNTLDEQLGHYFKKYTHIDSVKLLLLLQMKLMHLDVPIEVDNSMVTVDGKTVLTLENIPMWAENSDFQKLKAEYHACEQAYLDAKAATADPLTDSAFLQASEQWQDAKKALRELEQELFAIALKIEEKNNDGTLTARQRKAYELMEQGDAEGADRILDLREILDDIAHKENLAQQIDEGLEQNVQEMLQKIAIKKTQVKDPNRFDEIREIYAEAVGLEERRHLKKIAMWEYISYLHDQHDYKTAIPLAKRYQQYMELQSSKQEIVAAANILGILYMDTNQMKLAEQEYLRAKEILEELAQESPAAYLPDLAKIYNNLGTLFAQTNRADLARKEFLRAKDIYKQLVKENSVECLLGLAKSCNNLGLLYSDTNQMDLAEVEYLQAKKIKEQLTKEKPTAYLSNLATTCDNLGNLYANTKQIDLARAEYQWAKEIRKQLAQENPAAYLPDLADSCNNLGGLYYKTNQPDLAKKELQQAKDIYEQFVKISPERYTTYLQIVCDNLQLLSELEKEEKRGFFSRLFSKFKK
uniref:tetratricopeptide repeat protein n=1 Tax=Butyricicoccus sp. TaxID=2049021 RepID=UPI003D7CB1D7